MLSLKLMIPGYRARWQRRATVFLRELEIVCESFTFEARPDGPVALGPEGLVLHGLETPTKDAEMYQLLRPYLPSGLTQQTFRLARDIVTRYRYPHLRPDLSPRSSAGGPSEAVAMVGFHGQQKDGVEEITDLALQALFRDAFTPKAADVIIDCGAFIGIGAAAIAPLLQDGHLIALEADARNAALLQKNIEGNGLKAAEGLHRAIWNTHGDLLDLATGEAQANTLRHDVFDGGDRQKVQTVSIDGLVAEKGLTRVDMLSFTVNGAEVEALEGALGTLKTHRPRVRLAGWYERDGEKVSTLCRPVLEEAGYLVHVGARHGVLAIPTELQSAGSSK